MPRPRDIPSIQYRAENLVNITVPVRPNIGRFQLRAASCLVDAYGGLFGVPGFGTLLIQEEEVNRCWVSKGLLSTRNKLTAENDRNLSRFIYDPDEFATPSNPGVASSLPPDKNVSFVRIRPWNKVTGMYEDEGPITVIAPYDFFVTSAPVFTVSGVVPNLAWGYPVGVYPDTLDTRGVLSLQLPSFACTLQFFNTAAPAGKPIYLSFNLGMPPTIIMPGENIQITGSCPPELNIGADGGNPTFTALITVVNHSP